MFQRTYLEITNVCNLACAFCPGTTREKRFMAPEDFALLAKKLRPYTEYLYLHVMGEPLLHPQLAEILRTCTELDYRVCLTTNGTLLPEKLPLLRDCPALHKVSVSLHSFEGNGKSEGLEDYVAQAAASCLSLGERGVICALRLWNKGGADAENIRIMQLLSRIMNRDAPSLPADRKGNRRLAERLYLEPGEKFDWPHPDSARTTTGGILCLASPCASSLPCCATARWYPAAWTARGAWRWETC